MIVVGLIYIFLVGVSSLEAGIKVMGADTQERLFSAVSNPIAGLCMFHHHHHCAGDRKCDQQSSQFERRAVITPGHEEKLRNRS